VDLGEFAELGEATVSLVMPVCVCPSVSMEQIGYQCADFREIDFRGFFENLAGKFRFH